MALLFWRKTQDTGEYRPDGKAQTNDVVVSEKSGLPVRPLPLDIDEPVPMTISNVYLPPVAGQTIKRSLQVPGVGTGAIYAAGEAFGTVIKLAGVFRPEKGSGSLVGVVFHDLDDEGSQIDAVFFSQQVTTTADNAAFAILDEENLLCLGAVSITEFFNWGNNQVGVLRNLSVPLVAEGPDIYVRLVTQGTPTIAAGAVPWVTFYLVPD